jgi:hypothetical protein
VSVSFTLAHILYLDDLSALAFRAAVPTQHQASWRSKVSIPACIGFANQTLWKKPASGRLPVRAS